MLSDGGEVIAIDSMIACFDRRRRTRRRAVRPLPRSCRRPRRRVRRETRRAAPRLRRRAHAAAQGTRRRGRRGVLPAAPPRHRRRRRARAAGRLHRVVRQVRRAAAPLARRAAPAAVMRFLGVDEGAGAERVRADFLGEVLDVFTKRGESVAPPARHSSRDEPLEIVRLGRARMLTIRHVGSDGARADFECSKPRVSARACPGEEGHCPNSAQLYEEVLGILGLPLPAPKAVEAARTRPRRPVRGRRPRPPERVAEEGQPRVGVHDVERGAASRRAAATRAAAAAASTLPTSRWRWSTRTSAAPRGGAAADRAA